MNVTFTGAVPIPSYIYTQREIYVTVTAAGRIPANARTRYFSNVALAFNDVDSPYSV